MLTKNFLFGFNLVSLIGFALMGAGLTLSRQQRVGAPIAFGMMGAGTALLFVGLYTATP